MVTRVKDIEITIANRKSVDQGVYVGRPTALGNPYTTSGGRGRAIDNYRVWLREKLAERNRPVCEAMERLRKLAVREKRLVLLCWCYPLECHAEVIADELAKALSTGVTFALEVKP